MTAGSELSLGTAVLINAVVYVHWNLGSPATLRGRAIWYRVGPGIRICEKCPGDYVLLAFGTIA